MPDDIGQESEIKAAAMSLRMPRDWGRELTLPVERRHFALPSEELAGLTSEQLKTPPKEER